MLKKSLSCLTAAVCLTLSTALAMNTELPATATQPHTIQKSNRAELLVAQRRRRALRFKVPGVRASRNREGAAARGGCTPQDITAVLPPKPRTWKATQIPLELTVSPRPTFFVNVPETSARQARFRLLKDKANEVLFEKTLPVSATTGIMSFTLPGDAPALEVGKQYRWRLALICDPTDRNPATGGWIQRERLSRDVADQLQTASISDRLLFYAEKGYWHDTLKALADLRAANPSDRTLVTDWADVLKSVGLNAIADQPLVQLNSTRGASRR